MKITLSLTSSLSVDPCYLGITKTIARHIAQQGHSLVFGGTAYGMMEVLADEYKSAGGKELIGVMAQDLIDVTPNYRAHSELDQSYILPTMVLRKQKMMDLADAFLMLPGGYGTLEEITAYLGGNVNKLYSKPFAFYNYNGFYDKFFQFLSDLKNKGFSKVAPSDVSFISDDLDSIFEYFQNFQKQNIKDKFVD